MSRPLGFFWHMCHISSFVSHRQSFSRHAESSPFFPPCRILSFFLGISLLSLGRAEGVKRGTLKAATLDPSRYSTPHAYLFLPTPLAPIPRRSHACPTPTPRLPHACPTPAPRLPHACPTPAPRLPVPATPPHPHRSPAPRAVQRGKLKATQANPLPTPPTPNPLPPNTPLTPTPDLTPTPPRPRQARAALTCPTARTCSFSTSRKAPTTTCTRRVAADARVGGVA